MPPPPENVEKPSAADIGSPTTTAIRVPRPLGDGTVRISVPALNATLDARYCVSTPTTGSRYYYYYY
jgi:hypothetical protein